MQRPSSPSSCTRRGALLLALLLAACGDDADPLGGPPDQGPGSMSEAFDPFALLADPNLAARRLPGDLRLSSSRFPESPEGYGNADWGHYHGENEGRFVLLDATGPGVITRLWFTMTDYDVEPPDRSGSDAARLFVTLDGVPLDLGDGPGAGATLGDLTSGRRPPFEAPWVVRRADGGNAVIIALPMTFERSARVELVPPEIQVYYQVDWRALPAGTRVAPSALPPDAATQARIDRAADALRDPPTGTERATFEGELLPGGEAEVEVGAGIVRSLSVDGPGQLEATLRVDGEVAATGRVDRWLFAGQSAAPYDSTLSAFDGTTRTLRYPIPVEGAATLRLRNPGEEPVAVAASLGVDPGAPPAALGRFGMSCDAGSSEELTNRTFLELVGRGHLAGHHLEVRDTQYGWWFMEGDHEVFVDGAWTLLGTGIEDYFGGAYYFQDGVMQHPLYGITGFDLNGGPHIGSSFIEASMYRHHLLDAPSFQRELAFEYEITDPFATYDACFAWYADRGE
ncbi:MAG: DUF2961 domain-containing protein [Myxococcota bacterium]